MTLFNPDFSYLAFKIVHNILVEMQKFSNSVISSVYASLKYSFGLILPLFRFFLIHVPKLNVCDVHLSNGPSLP